MKALLLRAVKSRRLWLLAGVPVAAYVALSTVAHVSLFPPAVKSKHLAFVTAKTQLYVLPHGQLVDAPATLDGVSDPTQSTAQATVLANLVPSPELSARIAGDAGVDARKLAVDGPVPFDQPLASIEPAGPKRSYQETNEGDPYRITVDTSPDLPQIGITAQAPSTAVAVRLAAAAKTELSAYLTDLEEQAKLSPYQRLDVRSLSGIAVSGDGAGGLVNVAGLTFVTSLLVWIGIVFAIAALVRDLRAVSRKRPERVSSQADQPLYPW
jgi:hypothetical protein